MDAQTDLNIFCTHMPTCTLCWLPAQVVVEPCGAKSSVQFVINGYLKGKCNSGAYYRRMNLRSLPNMADGV